MIASIVVEEFLNYFMLGEKPSLGTAWIGSNIYGLVESSAIIASIINLIIVNFIKRDIL